MKSKVILTSLLCSSIYMLSACSTNPVKPITHGLFPAAMGHQKHSDADVLGIMVALNKGEIGAAREAEKRASSPAVKRYASFLDKQHTQNLKTAMHLSHKLHVQPAQNSVVQTLEDHAAREKASLASVQNRDFDRAYINDMINDHTEALHLIDHLLKETADPALVNYLKDTRAHVAMHLQKAEQLRKQLAS